MKKMLALAVNGTLLGLLICFNGSAQMSADILNGDSRNFVDPVYDVEFTLGLNPSSKTGMPISSDAMHQKVVKAFERSFKEASDVSWKLVGKKEYMAEFTTGGRKAKALFRQNGYMDYAICYGSEKCIPKGVSKLIRITYPDFRVGSACEVRTSEKEGWVVNLADEDYFVVIRVMDNVIDELTRYKIDNGKKLRKGKVIIPENGK